MNKGSANKYETNAKHAVHCMMCCLLRCRRRLIRHMTLTLDNSFLATDLSLQVLFRWDNITEILNEAIAARSSLPPLYSGSDCVCLTGF